jgi:hypothetical protein
MQNELKNEDAPLITIITPTYDREELLTYAYRSFTSQSIGNLEWIVLDDSEKPSIFMTTLDDPRSRDLVGCVYKVRLKSADLNRTSGATQMLVSRTDVIQ